MLSNAIAPREEATLERIAEIASSMRPDEFLELMYEVAADMAGEGVSLDELALLCDRICARLSIHVRSRLH
jgi:hypothetical protein